MVILSGASEFILVFVTEGDRIFMLITAMVINETSCQC